MGDPWSLVAHWWRSSRAWRAVGLGMWTELSRLPALSSRPEIAPRGRPVRAAAAPSVSPPVPTLSLSRGLGGPSGGGVGRDAVEWSKDMVRLARAPYLQDLSPAA